MYSISNTLKNGIVEKRIFHFSKRFFVSFKDLKISNCFTKVSHRDVRSPRSDRLGFAFLQRDMISKDRISPRSQQRRMNSQTTYNISHMQICFISNCRLFIFDRSTCSQRSKESLCRKLSFCHLLKY